MRLLFVASLAVVGLAGPLLVIAAGLIDGKPAPAIFGMLGLGLALGLGSLLWVGQQRQRRTMRHLGDKTGLTMSERPDIVPGLAGLSLAGEIWPAALCS